MRGSGPVVPAAPVAPVVSKNRSPGSKDGSITASRSSGRVKGGEVGLGLVRRPVQGWCRQGRVAGLVLRGDRDEIAGLARGRELLCFGEMRPRRAVRADDAFDQKVRNRIPARRNMGAVEVIEALVLADNDDDVLDRAGCRRAIRCGTWIGAGGGSGNPRAEQGNGHCDKERCDTAALAGWRQSLAWFPPLVLI